MFCPNCGNENSATQKFCRSCGLGLQKIAESIIEQMPTKQDLSLQQKRERFEKLGMAALSVFGVGALIPILYSIFYKLMWTQGKILAGLGLLGVLLLLACGLLAAIFFAKANELKETPASRNPIGPLILKPRENTGTLLNGADPQQPVFSVAERTTELLRAEKESADDRE